MIGVTVEIHSAVARFRTVVWAESIELAIGLAATRYPGCEAKVLFPIDPETFFVKGQAASSGVSSQSVPKEAIG